MSNDNKARRKQVRPSSEEIGVPLVTESPPESPAARNGRMPYPGSIGPLLIDEGDRGGAGQPEYRDFMTAHTENNARLLAEAVLDDDLLEQYLLVMEDDQQVWGFVSLPSIMKTKVAGTIGLKARGRGDAVQVATSSQAVMRKANSMWKRMFGGGNPQTPAGGMSTGEMGY